METWQHLDESLRDQATTDDVSGAVLLTQAGQTIFQGCYGLADRAAGVPIGPGTRFGLASVTKMFTAVAVADQVSTGRLALDSRVIDLLPPEARPTQLHHEVTVADLLLHTSGIADYAEEDESNASYLADYASLWLERPSYRMLRPLDFFPLFADLPPYRPPGRAWQYCNAGYVLLGIVLEHVTGRAYVDLVQDRVFDRAGMTASGFLRLDEPHPDVAVGYLEPDTPGGTRRTNIYSVPVVGGADGGAFSTLGDLDRFLHRVVDNSLMGEVTASMLEPRELLGGGYRHAYGFIYHPDGWFGHGGGDPGVACRVQRFPDDDAHVIVLCNVETWAGEVRDAVVQAWRSH
jgi:CubicO group peptidase (beta-lactamase class C family)